MKTSEFLKALQGDLALNTELTGCEVLEELGWDSMSALSFVALVDSKLGLQITGEQISDCQTVGDLLKIVESGLN